MFGSRPKPRQFHYEPRYYDPKKEERELRNSLKSDEKDEKYVPGSLIKKSRMKRMLLTDEDKAQSKKAVTTRLVIFIILLVVITYFLCTFTGFEVMVEAFQN